MMKLMHGSANGGSQELWDELGEEMGLKFSAGNTGTQAGGWFGKEINSADDFEWS